MGDFVADFLFEGVELVLDKGGFFVVSPDFDEFGDIIDFEGADVGVFEVDLEFAAEVEEEFVENAGDEVFVAVSDFEFLGFVIGVAVGGFCVALEAFAGVFDEIEEDFGLGVVFLEEIDAVVDAGEVLGPLFAEFLLCGGRDCLLGVCVEAGEEGAFFFFDGLKLVFESVDLCFDAGEFCIEVGESGSKE